MTRELALRGLDDAKFHHRPERDPRHSQIRESSSVSQYPLRYGATPIGRTALELGRTFKINERLQ